MTRTLSGYVSFECSSEVCLLLSFLICLEYLVHIFCFLPRAFIHQYTKFGMEEEDFLDSFALLEQVVASYGSLGP